MSSSAGRTSTALSSLSVGRAWWVHRPGAAPSPSPGGCTGSTPSGAPPRSHQTRQSSGCCGAHGATGPTPADTGGWLEFRQSKGKFLCSTYPCAPGITVVDYISARCSLPPAHPFQKILFQSKEITHWI